MFDFVIVVHVWAQDDIHAWSGRYMNEVSKVCYYIFEAIGISSPNYSCLALDGWGLGESTS